MSAEWISTISKRYIELYEKVIGEAFVPEELSDEETYNRIVTALQTL
jgi:phosphoribosylaminoimidazole-succinocarboxamide synthase